MSTLIRRTEPGDYEAVSRVLEYNTPLTTDTTPDRVFGQPSFITNTSGVTASRLNKPWGVALDARGNLYVSDQNNNRVLVYDAEPFKVMAPLVLR